MLTHSIFWLSSRYYLSLTEDRICLNKRIIKLTTVMHSLNI